MTMIMAMIMVIVMVMSDSLSDTEYTLTGARVYAE